MTDILQIEKLIGEGRFLEARTQAEGVLKKTNDLRITQLLALSMAKSGAPKAAMDFLEPVYQQNPENAETAGILGSIYKELFKETKNSKYALLSRDTYLKNYQLTGSFYTGINAASMSAIAGSLSKARELAKEIIARITDTTSDAWELATLGEAYLLLKEKEKSVEVYLRCRHALGSDWGKVNSIFNQLWLLNHYIAVSHQLKNTFQPPGVAAFTGHMIDHPSRKIRRFPSVSAPEVKQAIIGAIKSINAKIGYCSLACGGDIIFAEAIIETGGELNLFLPFDFDDFLQTSVNFAGEEWVQRFRRLMDKYPINQITKEKYLGYDDIFSFQTEVIFGSALHRSTLLHTTPHLITLFSDSDTVVKAGGTSDTLRHWPHPEKRININPQNFFNASTLIEENISHKTDVAESYPDDPGRKIRYLLFITTSTASHEDGEKFNYHLNKKLQELDTTQVQRTANSVMFAFETTGEALNTAWSLLKVLPHASDYIKITVHAGPVYIDKDLSTISGSTAVLVKEIQNFTVPGKVYASFHFASVLALDSDKYAIEYAGLVSINDQENMGIYQLNRHADAFDL